MSRNVISDSQARTIASRLQEDIDSPVGAFASTGTITDRRVLRNTVSNGLYALDVGRVRRPLLALDKYLKYMGPRGSVPGWSDLPVNEASVELDQCF